MEVTLMLVSVAAAALGFLLAFWLYYRRPELPARITARLGSLFEAVNHKYYVDEFYRAAIVTPIIQLSRTLLWQRIDVATIDGAVNDSADAARHVSDDLRHMQSGNIRSYAGWIATGAAVAIAYMIWLGVR